MDERPRRVIDRGDLSWLGLGAASSPSVAGLLDSPDWLLAATCCLAVVRISFGRSDSRRVVARSRPSFLGKLKTPRVRWRVPTGRMASGGMLKLSGAVTSAERVARLFDNWTLDDALTRGMHRKCVGKDFGGMVCSSGLEVVVSCDVGGRGMPVI